ncbi:MAG: hypothetical protein U0169_23645 [Polyangiaceae bacterium]
MTWEDLAPPLVTSDIDAGAALGAGGSSSGQGTVPAGANCSGPTKLEPTDPSTLPSCCSTGAAHCLAGEKLPDVVKSALTTCGTGGFCVPDPILRSGGAPLPRCKSMNNLDGACLSVCVPQVSQFKDLLPQATCAADERCAPCVSPLDNKRTGVCDIGDPVMEAKVISCSPDGGVEGGTGPSMGGDSGSSGPTPDLPCPHTGPAIVDPNTFPACGTGGGAHCVPTSLVPPAMTSRLATCPTGLCVPDTFIAANGRAIPPTCKSIGNLEGRCLHGSLPEVAAKQSLLPVSTCQSYERCTPCFDPQTGQATGACSLSCDPGPKTPPPGPPVCPYTGPPLLDPTAFPSCSSAGGAHCLNAALVPPAMTSQLKSCSGGYCVPDVFIASAGNAVPKTCRSLLNAEGRCLHVGLKQVEADLDKLPRSTCESYERCAPCYNPIDGQATGACSQSCDPGPRERPVTFSYCCGGAARCVPSTIVPASMQDRLDSCGGNQLCVPSEHLDDDYVPRSCQAFALLLGGTYDGVCLSDCLSFSFMENIVIKNGGCGSGRRCVPCYRNGQPTGAPGCQ